jgi:dimethylaniline monooxygenase (N-oxide forming)
MIDLDIGISRAFIGCARPAFGAVPTLSELSARYWALLLTGEQTLGPSARAERDSNRAYEERLFYRDASRIQSLVQYHRTMDSLATLIGCLPPIKELQVHHPDLHARVTHSALGGLQYRLVGDGWHESAWDALALYPLPEYTRQPRSAFRAKVAAGLFE